MESMQLKWKINVSNPVLFIPTHLVAMLVTPKPLPMFKHGFLMRVIRTFLPIALPWLQETTQRNMLARANEPYATERDDLLSY